MASLTVAVIEAVAVLEAGEPGRPVIVSMEVQKDELQLSPLEWEAAKQQMRAALDGSIGADASLQRRMLRELLDGE